VPQVLLNSVRWWMGFCDESCLPRGRQIGRRSLAAAPGARRRPLDVRPVEWWIDVGRLRSSTSTSSRSGCGTVTIRVVNGLCADNDDLGNHRQRHRSTGPSAVIATFVNAFAA
jgi:hypothetical protein